MPAVFSTYNETDKMVNSMLEGHIHSLRQESKPRNSERRYSARSFAELSIQEISQIMVRDADDAAPLVDILCEYLNDKIQKNDTTSMPKSSFDGKCALFSAGYYVKRIAKYSRASPCCLVAALLYLERAHQLRPALRLTSHTLQRLLLVAMMLATKYLEDECALNSRWAKIGGLTLRELNALEAEFLAVVSFDLSVHPDDYARCVAELRAFRPPAAAPVRGNEQAAVGQGPAGEALSRGALAGCADGAKAPAGSPAPAGPEYVGPA